MQDCYGSILLEFNFGTGLFDSLLQVLGFSLWHSLFQSRRSTVYEIFSLFESETASLFNSLYYLELGCTYFYENYIEIGLLFFSFSSCNRTSSNCNCSSGRFDTMNFFEFFCQLVNFFYCKIY